MLNKDTLDKGINFFKTVSPLKIIVISIFLGVVTHFIEKPLPTLFMTVRIAIFFFILYGVKIFVKEKMKSKKNNKK